MPMHVGAACLFDGPLDSNRYLRELEGKLRRLPRFRERVVTTPYYLGHPTWEPDPDFEIDRHVLVHRLARGDEAELRDEVAVRLSRRLDRDRPLWELHVLHGLEDGSSAILTKVHHAMVEGVGSNALLSTLFDFERNPEPRPSQEPAESSGNEGHDQPTAMASRQRITTAIWDTAQASIDAWAQFLGSVARIGRNYDAERSQTVLAVLGQTLPELSRPPRRLPFNRRCSGKKTLYWTSVPFAVARAIRGALGGTVNDVVLAALAGALTRYAELHGQGTSGRAVRVLVPVKVRRDGGRRALGNQASALPVHLPLGVADPARRLKLIRSATRTLKEGRFAEGVGLLTGLADALPVPLQASLGALGTSPFPMFNLVCTNEPGPQIPLYAAGRRLTAYYPYVPVGSYMGVSCAIFSYNQRLFIGINSDVGACPDADVLCRLLDESFEEMKVLAGVGDFSPIELGRPLAATTSRAGLAAQRSAAQATGSPINKNKKSKKSNKNKKSKKSKKNWTRSKTRGAKKAARV
jgi:WS/DGAT/MGAT family acyltransferase